MKKSIYKYLLLMYVILYIYLSYLQHGINNIGRLSYIDALLHSSNFIPFYRIHKFVPYTYSVDGFRKTISMTAPSLSVEFAVFAGILIVCSILTIVYFKYKNKEDKHVIPQMFEEVNSTKAE